MKNQKTVLMVLLALALILIPINVLATTELYQENFDSAIEAHEFPTEQGITFELNGESQGVFSFAPGEYKIMENINLGEKLISIGGGEFKFDLNGKKITSSAKYNTFDISDGALTITGNGTIENTNDYSAFAAYTDESDAIINATIENGTFIGGLDLYNSKNIMIEDATVVGPVIISNCASVTIQNGAYTSDVLNAIEINDCSSVTINGGTFNGTKNYALGTSNFLGGNVAKVVICGGIFTGSYGALHLIDVDSVVLKGGTFIANGEAPVGAIISNKTGEEAFLNFLGEGFRYSEKLVITEHEDYAGPYSSSQNSISVCAKNIKLEDIIKAFNNSNIVKSYEELLSAEITALEYDYDTNNLKITLKRNDDTTVINFKLEENILSNEQLTAIESIVACLLADTIGQVNGYEYGDVFNNFNMFFDEISNYVVENEGFEFKENGDNFSVKMDINKKIPLIPSSEFYLKPDDFDMIKEFVEEKTSGNQSGKKAKLVYNVSLGENENEICIGEEDKTTESTYKSILSALEVMYGKKVVEHFKSIYPKISEGLTELDGFSIETGVDIDLEESPMYKGTEVVRVKIDNSYVNEILLRTEYIGETVECGDKTITLDFTKNSSYKLGLSDSVKSSDVAFLIKYILEPLFAEEENVEIEDNIAYFNIVDGKIVVGDKNNSIFKIVISNEYLEILPSKTDVDKTTVTIEYKDLLAKEYKENAKLEDQFRYGKYNVVVNIIYGKEQKISENTVEKAEDTVQIKEKLSSNPKTGDTIMVWISLMIVSILGISGIVRFANKK